MGHTMSKYRTGTIWRARQGLTLVELLIAMVVLLVGIYTVARGFPLMLYLIRGEGDRTAMTRLAEQAMTRLSDNQAGLPDAITGGGSLHPESPSTLDRFDITAPHVAANALEDTVEVRGETLRVPAPYRDPIPPPPPAVRPLAYGYYVLGQGPTQCKLVDWPNPNAYPLVYMLVALTEREDDPRVAGALDLPGNWFYVDKTNGEVVVPYAVATTDGTQERRWDGSALPAVTGCVVDYAWCLPTGGTPTDAEPVMHYVQGEAPSDLTPWPAAAGQKGWTAKVHPAHLPSGILMAPGQTRVWARVDFTREEYADTDQYPDGPGRYVLDRMYGVRLVFHPADVGLTLKVDYQLQTYRTGEDPPAPAPARRMLFMIEDVPIESAVTRHGPGPANAPFGEVRLAVKGVDDVPVFTKQLNGTTALASPVHVLAVDLQTGQVYTDGTPFALEDSSLRPELLQGFENGIVAYPLGSPGAPASYVGHTLRFYYRTLDRHTVQVQKGPRSYVDSETAETYLTAYAGQDESLEVDYRTYRLSHVASPNDPTRRLAELEFGQWLSGGTWASAESSSGMTVAVNYSYVDTAGECQYVWGELHTVPSGGRKITLNHATDATHPVQVLAVSGASARARGWWLNRTGRAQTLSIDTVFLANALGLVPKVR